MRRFWKIVLIVLIIMVAMKVLRGCTNSLFGAFGPFGAFGGLLSTNANERVVNVEIEDFGSLFFV